MIKLIKSAKFKKTISFTIAILLIGFAIYITTLDYDYFLGIGCSVFIIAGILLIIEAINITETKPKIQTKALDEDALWRVVCEHIGRGYELKAEPQQIIKSTNQTEAFCL